MAKKPYEDKSVNKKEMSDKSDGKPLGRKKPVDKNVGNPEEHTSKNPKVLKKLGDMSDKGTMTKKDKK